MMPRCRTLSSSIHIFILLSLVAAPRFPAIAIEAPRPVSPGEPAAVPIVDRRCPTFSWAQSEGVEGYELVIYDLSEDEALSVAGLELAPETIADTRPILRVTLPVGSSSWTPSGADCLELGGSYAWVLGSQASGHQVAWSEAYLFEVQAPPVATEVRAVLEALERRLEQCGDPTVVPLAVTAPAASSSAARAPAVSSSIPSLSSIALMAEAESGSAAGAVKGLSDSAGGIAGVFQNTNASGTILSGQNATTEVFKVDSSGAVTAMSFTGDGSGLTGVGGTDVVASFAVSDDLAEPSVAVMTTVLQTAIQAPTSGVLLVSAGVDADNLTSSDAVQCRIRVDGSPVVGSHMFTAQDSSANANEEENCTTVAATNVVGGSRTVEFQVLRGDSDTTLNDATLWVLWAPASP